MPLKTLFGDVAALQEYVQNTTDNLLLEYISITGMGRGTGVAGATSDVPVGEPVMEEADADDRERADGTPGGTD
eukprot:7243995-Prorocentrum_lima.AAC.1